MATTPYQMNKPEDLINHQLVVVVPIHLAHLQADYVNQLEHEVDFRLSKEQKGQKEYHFSWVDDMNSYAFVSKVNLEALAEKFKRVGWTVKFASDKRNRVSSLTLQMPEIHTSV